MPQTDYGFVLRASLYEPISGVFLNHSVTDYEAWAQHFTVETKMYSMIENTRTPLQQRSSKHLYIYMHGSVHRELNLITVQQLIQFIILL